MGVCDWFKRRHKNKKKKENMPLKFEDPVDLKVAKVTACTVNKPEFLTSNREYAATRIQIAFRAYKARKTLSYLKKVSRFQELTKMMDSLTKQAPPVLERLHFWSKIQAEISGRRLCKVAEGRMKQVKLQDRIRVESKIHKHEMKWWSGPVIKEENGSKVQRMEKATNKHERALAYAFSHQWRPNSTRCFGQAYYDLSKESWGWNWTEPWIVIYKLESHVVIRPIVSPRARVRERPRVGVLSNKSKRVGFHSFWQEESITSYCFFLSNSLIWGRVRNTRSSANIDYEVKCNATCEIIRALKILGDLKFERYVKIANSWRTVSVFKENLEGLDAIKLAGI